MNELKRIKILERLLCGSVSKVISVITLNYCKSMRKSN